MRFWGDFRRFFFAPKHRDMVDSSAVLRMKNQNGSKNNNEILAELQCDGLPVYHVRQQRCIVGRDLQVNHMAITSSNLVSRQHIEVRVKKKIKKILREVFQFMHDGNNDRFLLICNGKNGIFVDGIFHKKTESVTDAIALRDK